MSATVKKPFNSHRRRYRVGDPVQSSDDLAPHSFNSLLSSEFIELPSADEVPAEQRKPRLPK